MGLMGFAGMLAEAAPRPDFFMQLVLSVALIASVACNIAMLFRGSKPQERVVSFTGEFAGKEIFDKHVEENRTVHELLHKRISDGDKALAVEFKADVNCLREDISQCRSELAAAARSNEHQNQALMRIEAKIDNNQKRH